MKTLRKFIYKNPEISIISFAVLIRVVSFFIYPQTTIFNDSADYLALAQRLSELNLNGYGGFRTPGYPLLIVLGLKMPIFIVFLQHILSITTALFIYHLVRRKTSHKTTGIISAMVYCVLLHVLFFEKGILTETLSAFLLTWLLFQLHKNVICRKFKPHQFWLLALILLLLVMTKPFFIYMLPVLVLFFILLLGKTMRFKILKPIVILSIPTLLFYVGWSQLNKQNTGYYTVTTYYGINLAQEVVNFVEKAPDDYAAIRDIYVKQRDENRDSIGYVYYAIWDAHEDMMQATDQNFYELSNELAAMSKATIINNPEDYLKQIGVSWMTFWDVKIYWDQDAFKFSEAAWFYRAFWHIQRPLIILGKAIFMLFFFISLGICIFKKKVPINMYTFIFVAVIGGSILQGMVNYSENYRFSFPYLPAIIIIIASYCVKMPAYLVKKT